MKNIKYKELLTLKDSVIIFKALADKSRLRILNSLMETPKYVELLAERLELSPSTISFHLKKLEDAGLVKGNKEQYYVVYSLNKDTLNTNLLDLVVFKEGVRAAEEEREEAYRKKVIENFFKYGKLISIPVQQKKRRIVLEEIAKAFEKGVEYKEREVNIIIADFNDDFCTIRREFISEKIFERNNGIYKRIL